MKNSGFTLIELSIVLVIIGLIIGGVLVGQDLIAAAATRATITQIEKYNTATNTFKVKYGYLPGDIPDPYASQFGFVARGLCAGEGDGNGIIEGNFDNNCAPFNNVGSVEDAGETVMFWVDLSTTRFIDGNFNTGSPTSIPGALVTLASSPALSAYFPQAKIGNGNFFVVWSGTLTGTAGTNYMSIFAITSMDPTDTWADLNGGPGMTVAQAYNIDKKIDDGLPQFGRVTAQYLGQGPEWAGGGGTSNSCYPNLCTPYTTAITGSVNTCFDNGGVVGNQKYSMEISNGSNVNCALSFQMQGAAR